MPFFYFVLYLELVFLGVVSIVPLFGFNILQSYFLYLESIFLRVISIFVFQIC